MTRIISIEGNIGSGKSMFVKELETYCNANIKKMKIHFLQEPVDIWNNVQTTKIKEGIYLYKKKSSFKMLNIGNKKSSFITLL